MQTYTPSDRPSLERRVITDLRQLNRASNNVVTVEMDLAEALWPYRLTFTVKSKGVNVPDYHGRSDGYKAGFESMKAKAGLVVVKATTPFEAAAIDLVNARIDGAVRKAIREIADRDLTLAELLAAGFKRSKALPADQKIPASVETGRRTKKEMPVDVVIGEAVNGLLAAAKRPGDIRELTIEKRHELVASLVQAATQVGRILQPTKAEEAKAVAPPATTLTGTDLVNGLKAEAAARKAPAKRTPVKAKA